MSAKILFDTQHLYYLPQYLPVAEALSRQGAKCQFVLYPEAELDAVKEQALTAEGFSFVYLEGKTHALEFYARCNADWVIFGNVPAFDASDKHRIAARLALMQHGIGPKSCYYDVSEFPFDVRFVEGQERLKRLSERFSDRSFVDTGYAKLDPIFRGDAPLLPLSSLGLSEQKQTILYAPTFFPSSIEHFPLHWPEQLQDYNLIVKPHFFSLTKSKYAAQRERFSAWQQYGNVYLAGIEDYNLVPFMQISDIMLSDASSAIFEFAAMDKPVVWCDFYRTRWSYSGLLKFRLKQRLDPDIELFHTLTRRAASAKQVKPAIIKCLSNPHDKQAERADLTKSMVGTTDGLCSSRIARYLADHVRS
ncbi:CDP-glycerol--poly(glycerophosphate) glycerophosphotransferase [Alteromonas aestuariivivens]|uniref:CDP-glycerol--poly(Glycerophosphate) glycerophosphotransferase n=1 Tax=Alteromonas aestuariivivens TaxID=1938339 RepID=A0A3D8M2M1_9ALTE|nr:CDP-glycerol glycerophosphotransferase family protein [Alteromonas aestuariivivens]RDV23953.1 CDP-glycerol--poly(glycerophosphate) glycerophosphotransferase [Alteromonas aestuariivivens]